MKRQTINDIFSSFYLWFENSLLSKGEAFTNVNSLFYPIKDDKLKNYSVYATPYKQFAYDSSVPGTTIPSGIYSNGTFIPRGQSGLTFDFNNGRLFFSGNVTIPVSGQISAKQFNTYSTTQSDQELIFENRINFASQFPVNPTGILGNDIVAPAVFLRFEKMGTEPFALGGQYNDRVNARAVILSDSVYSLDAIGNIFVTQKEKNFLVFNQTPLNEWGDLKTGYFSYNQYLNQYYDSSKLAYIEDVDLSKLSANNLINPDLRVGFLDFVIRLTR